MLAQNSLFFFVFAIVAFTSQQPVDATLSFATTTLYSTNVRICIQNSTSTPSPLADVIYFHGFGDRCDNHQPLFSQLASVGFRVIGFDYPSHGEDSGSGDNINLWTFTKLAQLAAQVELVTRDSTNGTRPMLLLGWSTGGLLLTRIVQELNAFARPIAGVVAHAPAIAPQALVGSFGFVTLSTLTRNPTPPIAGPIVPDSPLKVPIFAADLLLNSAHAQSQSFPSTVPGLYFFAGSSDKYVQSKPGMDWTMKFSSLQGIQCPAGYHWLDVEPEPMGYIVRNATTSFLRSVVLGQKWVFQNISTVCVPFK